jgi:hypothetical protein
MAFSVSFHLRWDTVASNRNRMSDWAEGVNRKLDQRDAQRNISESLQLYRARAIEEKGSLFFQELKDAARRGVERLKSRPELSELSFEPFGHGFKVKNTMYPAVFTEVQLTGHGIALVHTILENEKAAEREERRYIDFEIDQADNLRLRYGGEPTAGIRATLDIILGPTLKFVSL